MPACITCDRIGGALISMQHCKNCYYKRIHDDVSTVFCKYRTRETVKEMRLNMIKEQERKTENLKAARDRQYTMGRPRLAEDTDRKVKKAQKRHKELIIINEAIVHITKQAMELAEQLDKREVIIKVEEHLTAVCIDTETADKLLDKEKSLAELYSTIEEKAKGKVVSQQGTACTCLTSEDVFAMTDEYYGIAGAKADI